MKHLMILAAFFLLASTANAQELKKVEEVEIQTSAKCFDCKGRIEDALNYLKGVVFAALGAAAVTKTVF